MPSNITVEPAFLAQQRALRDARAARFAADANKPPPPPPPKILAHPGGKIVTSDKRAALLSLLARQTSPPTAAQQRALAELSSANGRPHSNEERWPRISKVAQPGKRPSTTRAKRAHFIRCCRGPRLKLTPWARRTCTATAFIFRRRRRIVMQRRRGPAYRDV